MNAKIFIADILVNATGAMMIMLFVFVTRLNPEPVLEKAPTLDRTLMVVDVTPGTADDHASSSYAASLTKTNNGLPLNTLWWAFGTNGTSNLVVHSNVPTAGQYGTWGTEIIEEGSGKNTLRFIVPCPLTGSWELALIYPWARSAREGDLPVNIKVKALPSLRTSLKIQDQNQNQNQTTCQQPSIDQSEISCNSILTSSGEANVAERKNTILKWQLNLEKSCAGV